jgi:hypothetical protein
MRLAHLILAHNNPEQLERLISRLLHPEADIYIHIDKKTPIEQFGRLTKIENVFFIKKRIKIHWGAYSIVEATLNGFKEILKCGKEYGYVNLLSGQDYPLKPAAYIHQYLTQNQGVAFMNYLIFDPDWREALPRVEEYHFNNYKFPGRYIFQKQINRLLPKRKFPNGFTPVGRSQWFTVPTDCVNYLINYWDNNKKLRNFIKFTWGADEFLFQTILYNSDYRDMMINKDLRYIDWSDGGVSPKYLSVKDADLLLKSTELFARKFDMYKEPAILDLIDISLNKASA